MTHPDPNRSNSVAREESEVPFGPGEHLGGDATGLVGSRPECGSDGGRIGAEFGESFLDGGEEFDDGVGGRSLQGSVLGELAGEVGRGP
jgi:hypothetical protein